MCVYEFENRTYFFYGFEKNFFRIYNRKIKFDHYIKFQHNNESFLQIT